MEDCSIVWVQQLHNALWPKVLYLRVTTLLSVCQHDNSISILAKQGLVVKVVTILSRRHFWTYRCRFEKMTNVKLILSQGRQCTKTPSASQR